MNLNNISISIQALLLSFALFISGYATAHPVNDQRQPDKVEIILLADITLTPPRDDDMITLDGLKGPKDSKGIASIEPRGIIELGEDFPQMAGRQLRARVFTIEPGGVVGIHTHVERPGYAYIISGKIIEHRNDAPNPIEHSAGSIAMEKAGVTHWWENTFDEPVKALVVDIFTPE